MTLAWEAPALCRTTVVDGDGLLGIRPEFFGAPPDVVGGEGGGLDMTAMFPTGIIARPRDPDVDTDGNPSAGAAVVYGYSGDAGYAAPQFDWRLIGAFPMPDKGGTVLVGDAGPTGVAWLALRGEDGVAEVVVPDGASIRLRAPSGRTLTVSAAGIDMIGAVQAGVPSGDDPGSNPAAVAIAAGPLTDFLAKEEAWAVQVDVQVAAVSAALGIPITPVYAAAITQRSTAAGTVASPYPAGMAATRLNAR